MAHFVLWSDAFANGEPIPSRYARDGDNVSPPLGWENPPAGTRSFALVMEDPNAPFTVFRHWVVSDIPADWRALPEGLPDGNGGVRLHEGVNSFGDSHYDGPMPPPLHGTHHYHFRLFALDIECLDLSPDASADRLMRLAASHVLAETQLIGTYKRTLAATLFGTKPRTRETGQSEAKAHA
jgi:Raf kinase inhibitor-like YbhB/YbcL family protein